MMDKYDEFLKLFNSMLTEHETYVAAETKNKDTTSDYVRFLYARDEVRDYVQELTMELAEAWDEAEG